MKRTIRTYIDGFHLPRNREFSIESFSAYLIERLPQAPVHKNATIMFSIDENAFVDIFSVRLETDEEEKTREDLESEVVERALESQLARLRFLINKYPKEANEILNSIAADKSLDG